MPALFDQLGDLFATEADVRLAILFGSRAGGHAGAASDLDVAVLTDRPMDAPRRQQLSDRLALLAGTAVDLVDLSTVGGALLGRILRHGRVITRRDPGALGRLFERFLDWQADLAPAVTALLESRRQKFSAAPHG